MRNDHYNTMSLINVDLCTSKSHIEVCKKCYYILTKYGSSQEAGLDQHLKTNKKLVSIYTHDKIKL